MKNPVTKLALLAAGAALFGGCISHESTVVRDTERTRVEFENDAAARVFYETLSKHGCKEDKSESTTKFEIPIIFEHKRHVVSGSGEAFNRAVARCDTNRDGKITELEAKIYAEQAAK